MRSTNFSHIFSRSLVYFAVPPYFSIFFSIFLVQLLQLKYIYYFFPLQPKKTKNSSNKIIYKVYHHQKIALYIISARAVLFSFWPEEDLGTFGTFWKVWLKVCSAFFTVRGGYYVFYYVFVIRIGMRTSYIYIFVERNTWWTRQRVCCWRGQFLEFHPFRKLLEFLEYQELSRITQNSWNSSTSRYLTFCIISE